MITYKKRNIYFLILLFVAIFFIGLIGFELTTYEVKGESNIVKEAYFRMASILPAKSAVRLAVPFHRQERKLSCEVASLQMALRYRGVKITESQLIEKLPFAATGPRSKANIWGDPNLGFVGDINGKMPNTGYGVYEQPIFDLASKYRKAKIINNAALDQLIQELINKNPVIVWGVMGAGKDISWKTDAGKTINAKMNEHARLLIGYTGKSDNPKLLILLDPIYGEVRMNVKSFLANWSMLDKRAVVIY